MTMTRGPHWRCSKYNSPGTVQKFSVEIGVQLVMSSYPERPTFVAGATRSETYDIGSSTYGWVQCQLSGTKPEYFKRTKTPGDCGMHTRFY